MTELEQHLDPLDLARLAEGKLPEAIRDQSSRHLADCSHCAAIYAEVVAAHLETPQHSDPVAANEWIRLGLQAGPRTVALVPPRATPLPRRRWAWAMGTAAVVVLAGGLLLVRSGPSRPERLSAETRAEIGRWASEDSYGGLLYSAQCLPRAGSTRGNPVGDDRVLAEIQGQVRLYPDDANLSFWLICATVSAKQFRLSAGYLADARRNFPRDPRFANLEAILAFQQGDLTAAERHLREALAGDRTGVAEANLVRVLTQLGRRAEADSLAAELRRKHHDLAAAAGL